MTGSCCICKKSYRHSSVHLFRFPFKNPVKLRKWVDAVKIPGFWPSKSTRVCNDHFLETDYDISSNTKIPRLKDCAVPCQNLNVIQTKEPRPILAESESTMNSSKPQTTMKQPMLLIADSPPVLPKPDATPNSNAPPIKINPPALVITNNVSNSPSVLPKPNLNPPIPQIKMNQPPFIIANSLNNQNKILCLTSLNKAIQRTNASGPIILRPLPPLVPTSNVKRDVSTQMATNSDYLNKFKQKKMIFSSIPSLTPIVNQVEVPNKTIQTIGIQTKIETETEIELKKKVKALQQKIRRKEKKISCLKEVLYALKKRGVLEPDAGELIDHYFDDSE